MLTESTIYVSPTYDSEGAIYAIFTYPDGRSEIKPYRLPSTRDVEVCPFCATPLYQIGIPAQRTYCFNNECHPRIQQTLQKQVMQLGLNSAHLQPVLGSVFAIHSLPSGSRNLIMAATSLNSEIARAEVLARLAALSFSEFLMLMHLPADLMGQIEDDLAHCVSIRDLYRTLLFGNPMNYRSPVAFAAGRMAIAVNAPYALALIEFNRDIHQGRIWTETEH